MNYRKVSPRFWKDEAIVRLSVADKLVALYVMTAQTNRVGLFSFSPAMAAEDIGMDVGEFANSFERVLEALDWQYDSVARVVYIHTWWKYNAPENPKHTLGCLRDLQQIPATFLIKPFAENTKFLPKHSHETLKQFISDSYGDTYGDSYTHRSPIPISEREELPSESVAVAGAVAVAVTEAGAGTSMSDTGADAPSSGPSDLPEFIVFDDAPLTTQAWKDTGLWAIQSKSDAKALTHVPDAILPLVRDFGDELVARCTKDYDRWRRDKGKTRCKQRKRHDRAIAGWVRREAERMSARGEAPTPGSGGEGPDLTDEVKRLEEMGR